MIVKIEARILIFPGTDFHFPSTSVPPGTFFKLCPQARPKSCRGTSSGLDADFHFPPPSFPLYTYGDSDVILFHIYAIFAGIF